MKCLLKRVGKAILFPHLAVMIFLIPLSAVLLVGSMVFIGTETASAYVSYAVSAYTLTVWCVRIPDVIRFFRAFRAENKLVLKWREDARLRVKASLYGSLIWNSAYALLQLWLGFYHRTFWFLSLGAYYVCLAIMRFFLLEHSRKYAPGERVRAELIKYRACGWILLVMNLSLSLIIFFMLYWDRSFNHHMITAIAMAAYTFTAFTTAVVSAVKYRKFNSPVFSATKTVGLVSACVSMLTLTSTMLTTFSDGTMDRLTEKLLLGGVGLAVSVTVITMAVYMIAVGTKKLKNLRGERL